MLQTQRDQLIQQKHNLEQEKTKLENGKVEVEKKLEEQKAVVAQLQDEVKKITEQAQEVSEERVNTQKTRKALEAELKKITQSINEKEKQMGNREEITKECEIKRKGYDETKKAIANSKSLLERMDMALKQRVAQWYQYRSFIAMRAKFMFIRSLEHRGYNGQLKFNHSENKLALLVQTKESKVTRDTKQLSGGERSFSTVCFLLALWEATECPFRALDEYDVFMDAVNRRISTSMIIDAANLAKNRQFILISPQDMSGVKLSSDVTVVRLEPPERSSR